MLEAGPDRAGFPMKGCRAYERVSGGLLDPPDTLITAHRAFCFAPRHPQISQFFCRHPGEGSDPCLSIFAMAPNVERDMGPSLRSGDERARTLASETLGHRDLFQNRFPQARAAQRPAPSLFRFDSNSTASLHGSRAEGLPGPLVAELSCVRLVIPLPQPRTLVFYATLHPFCTGAGARRGLASASG